MEKYFVFLFIMQDLHLKIDLSNDYWLIGQEKVNNMKSEIKTIMYDCPFCDEEHEVEIIEEKKFDNYKR